MHVNRVLRSLREQELVLFKNSEVTILNLARLRSLGEFDPFYLYEDGQPLSR